MHFKGQEWAGDTGGGDTGAGGAGGGAGNGDGGDGVVAGWYAVSECGVFNFTLNHPLITKLHITRWSPARGAALRTLLSAIILIGRGEEDVESTYNIVNCAYIFLFFFCIFLWFLAEKRR